MSKGLYFAAFIIGAVIGSTAACYCVKKKYEKIAQEEIDSVKEVFAKRESVKEKDEAQRQAADVAKEKPDVKEYAAMLQSAGYTSHLYDADGERRNDSMKEKHPYVIPPEDFGEFEDYETISLTYYADGVLADENDEVVDDVEDIVGDALDHFGEYEDDSVFVRCDERRCDYEILLDQRNFSEVSDNKPRQVEV